MHTTPAPTRRGSLSTAGAITLLLGLLLALVPFAGVGTARAATATFVADVDNTFSGNCNPSNGYEDNSGSLSDSGTGWSITSVASPSGATVTVTEALSIEVCIKAGSYYDLYVVTCLDPAGCDQVQLPALDASDVPGLTGTPTPDNSHTAYGKVTTLDCDDAGYAAANPTECTVLDCDDAGYAAANPTECTVLDCTDAGYAAANPLECGDCDTPEYAAANPTECSEPQVPSFTAVGDCDGVTVTVTNPDEVQYAVVLTIGGSPVQFVSGQEVPLSPGDAWSASDGSESTPSSGVGSDCTPPPPPPPPPPPAEVSASAAGVCDTSTVTLTLEGATTGTGTVFVDGIPVTVEVVDGEAVVDGLTPGDSYTWTVESEGQDAGSGTVVIDGDCVEVLGEEIENDDPIQPAPDPEPEPEPVVEVLDEVVTPAPEVEVLAATGLGSSAALAISGVLMALGAAMVLGDRRRRSGTA